MAEFDSSYVSETHPSRDDLGNPLFDFYVDLFYHQKELQNPKTINLYEVLEKIFENSENEEPDLQPLREILLSLIEHGGRHDYHGERRPILGHHQCARKVPRNLNLPYQVYCRYLFPREFFKADEMKQGKVKTDPFRAN